MGKFDSKNKNSSVDVYQLIAERIADMSSRLESIEPMENCIHMLDYIIMQERRAGKPTFVSEYGGFYWNPANEEEMDKTHGSGNWGYGDAPRTKEEFVARFKGQTEAFLFHPCMGALCYTQLTDVEQEQNGLYTYDRKAKFDPAIFHAILSQKAAIEKDEK